MHFSLHHAAHRAEKIVSVHFGTGGGGWSHPQGGHAHGGCYKQFHHTIVFKSVSVPHPSEVPEPLQHIMVDEAGLGLIFQSLVEQLEGLRDGGVV